VEVPKRPEILYAEGSIQQGLALKKKSMCSDTRKRHDQTSMLMKKPSS
jgi:hypothetical protein